MRRELREARAGDPADLRRVEHAIVAEHLWLADRIARHFARRGEDLDDLTQVARTALVEAVQRYDPDQGPLLAYAHPSISGVIKRHFRDLGWLVRPPRSTQQLSVRINQQWSRMAQERGHCPTDAEIAADLTEPVDRVREARAAGLGYRAVSWDTPAGQFDPPGPDDDVNRCEAGLIADQVWDVLTTSERQLLQMRFWEGRSQADIAQTIGTSQMQVSRLLTRTINRIRTELSVEYATGA